MEIIKTKSFELATISQGNQDVEKVVLLLPGQLDTKDYAHMVSHLDYLAKKGYFALSFDPPGTWESPGDIKLYTITNYLKAIHELIEYLGNKPTILMGHSRGGSMAMLAGPQNKYVTHMIAIMSNITPSKLPNGYSKEKVKDGKKISYRDLPPNDTQNKKRFDLPLYYFEDAQKHDILAGLKDCSKPKLFFYGLKDELVNIDDARGRYKAIAQPKTMHELNTEHDYRLHQDMIDEVNNVTDKFLINS